MRSTVFFGLVALLGCSGSATGAGTSSSGSTSSSGGGASAVQACKDMANAVANAAQRCGQDYQTNYDEFVKAAANGDCANVKQIRDEGALRQTCIPSLSTISCANLNAGAIDASCKSQLVRPAGVDMPLPVTAASLDSDDDATR